MTMRKKPLENIVGGKMQVASIFFVNGFKWNEINHFYQLINQTNNQIVNQSINQLINNFYQSVNQTGNCMVKG